MRRCWLSEKFNNCNNYRLILAKHYLNFIYIIIVNIFFSLFASQSFFQLFLDSSYPSSHFWFRAILSTMLRSHQFLLNVLGLRSKSLLEKYVIIVLLFWSLDCLPFFFQWLVCWKWGLIFLPNLSKLTAPVTLPLGYLGVHTSYSWSFVHAIPIYTSQENLKYAYLKCQGRVYLLFRWAKSNYARSDGAHWFAYVKNSEQRRPEFIFLRNMYGWLFDIRCTLLCISALFLICFHSSVYMFFSLYICLFICTFVLFCIFLLFSMVTTGRAAGCSTSEIKLGLAPDKSGNGASSAWSHFAHLLFLSHWEASALPCLMPGHSLPDHIHCVTRPEFWPIPTLFCPFLRLFLTLEKRTSLPLSTRYPIRYKAWCALSPLPSKIFCSQCCSPGKVAIIAASVDLLHVMSTITPWNYLSFKVCPYIQIMTQKPWPANHSVPQKAEFFLVSQKFNPNWSQLGGIAYKYHTSISEIYHLRMVLSVLVSTIIW